MVDGDFIADSIFWRGRWRGAVGVLEAAENLCEAMREQWPHLDTIPSLVLKALDDLERELNG